jgi:quercetin dioxygenase-like cupin family protein
LDYRCIGFEPNISGAVRFGRRTCTESSVQIDWKDIREQVLPGSTRNSRMVATDFDAERVYDDERFSTSELFYNDRLKVICGYFEPGQFIPVHAPASDLVLTVQSGTGTVRDGDTDRAIESGNVVVVEAETPRGIKADDDSRLELLLVTAPPPTDAEHAPVREGLRRGEFEPPDGDE